jgi:hypothetical protein
MLSSHHTRNFALLAVVVALTLAPGASANDRGSTPRGDLSDNDGARPESWSTYVQSDRFKASGARCGTLNPSYYPELPIDAPQDCTLYVTNPDGSYDPGPLYEIPVVVHIITHANGVSGDISNAMVQSQIDVLNEDFLAIPGTLGEDGTYTGIQFVLASEDPNGDPTDGITRTANTNWYNDNDEAGFKSTLMWDPHRYLNFYTNNTPYLGYAWFPQWGVGFWQDGVVINYRSFGRNSPQPPYHLGRTATHEVGHWIGLLHTFEDGCGNPTPPFCYSTADLICDTEPDAFDTYNCPVGSTSCGGQRIPVENYMEYTNDACMEKFTPEQMRRLRCTLTSYRPNIYTEVEAGLFSDGFESGDTSEWSTTGP